MRQYLGYPKWRHHSVHPPRQVRTPEEESRLTPSDEGWGDTYIYKKYPKAKYHPVHTGTEKHRIVKDEAEERALGEGWYDSPAQFPKGLPEAGAAPATAASGVDPAQREKELLRQEISALEKR